ncbi:hypothetical protein B0H11DRAFT_1955911 [Mycena galericulata]|nr:hypothetical protein B0H11DRAFT_1955911 [Mycena galericulata]
MAIHIHQYPLDKTFLVATWLESLVYGFYLCVFCLSIYVNVTSTGGRTTHNQIMFAASLVMFLLASLHLAMNCYRLIRGYVDFGMAPGGPVGYLGVLSTWHHIFKDTLYATQSILGDAVAVFRCWILWNQDYKVVAIPFVLLLTSTVSGYMVCGLYTTVNPAATVFDPRLGRWITTFYSIAVAQNILTTSLMALRLWKGEKESSRYRLGGGVFLPVIRILVESAALYLFVEILLLTLYAINYNAQYILLEIVTPIVGITFSTITVRISLRAHARSQKTGLSGASSNGRQTFGSMPMRPIAVNITTRVEDDNNETITEFDK